MENELDFKKVEKVFRTGIHQYEPVATKQNTTKEGEIKITSRTRWIPMCQMEAEKPDYLYLWEINAINDIMARLNLLSVISKPEYLKKECEECLVLCFREHLEMLDIIPLREMFPSPDEEENLDDEGYIE